MSLKRTELQREVVDALIESRAVDFEAVGSVLAKYGERAARTGDGFAVIINWRAWDICIPPFTLDHTSVRDRGQFAAGAAEEQ